MEFLICLHNIRLCRQNLIRKREPKLNGHYCAAAQCALPTLMMMMLPLTIASNSNGLHFSGTLCALDKRIILVYLYHLFMF
jgi:hypothetical protein